VKIKLKPTWLTAAKSSSFISTCGSSAVPKTALAPFSNTLTGEAPSGLIVTEFNLVFENLTIAVESAYGLGLSSELIVTLK
jgi:hypothetical protein